MGTTSNIGLTEIGNGEVDGDVTINEALWRLDFWANRVVQDMTLTGPPASPSTGWAYVVQASASGAWAGKENNIAHYFNSAWNFYPPKNGWQVIDVSSFVTHYYSGTGWGVYASAP